MAKILVVEDNAATMRMVHAMLAKDGHQVVQASNGKVGYETAVSEHPDLILLDLLMPVMDGFEALQHLRANPDTESIPVIILTAMMPEDGEAKGLQLGVSHYIQKPVEPDILRIAVRSVIRESKSLVPEP